MIALRAFFSAMVGDVEAAERDAEVGWRLVRESGAPWMHAEVLVVLAQLARVQGRPARALELLGQSRAIAAEVGHGWAWASSLWMIARVHLETEDEDGALGPLREMLDITAADRDATSTLAGL